jgi:hypothetical protein
MTTNAITEDASRASSCTSPSRCSEWHRGFSFDRLAGFHQCGKPATKRMPVNPGESRDLCDNCAGLYPGWPKTDIPNSAICGKEAK